MEHEAFYQTPEFWVAIAFLIFVALVAKKVGGMVVSGLDARAARIKADIEEAAKLRDEAQALLADYQRRQRQAETEAKDILAAAETEAARMRSESMAQLDAALKRREAMAMDRIARAEAQALAEVRNLAVDVALNATRRLITDGIDAARARALVDDAIKGLAGRIRPH
ncbi:MAG: F0F1 ATP synthase subunit B [Alphaproteobacteria bacterium]